MARYTNEDRALNAMERFRDIIRTTTSNEVLALARDGYEHASLAAHDFNNARAMDKDTGGGSGVAWGCRSKGSRRLKKANAIMDEIDKVGVGRADYGKPSIIEMDILQKVKAADPEIGLRFSWDNCVPGVTSEVWISMEQRGWLRRRWHGTGDYHHLTDVGTALIEAARN